MLQRVNCFADDIDEDGHTQEKIDCHEVVGFGMTFINKPCFFRSSPQWADRSLAWNGNF